MYYNIKILTKKNLNINKNYINYINIMGVCQGGENRIQRILELTKQFPTYHEFKDSQDYKVKLIQENENDLWEHREKFLLYESELAKSNPVLHKKFFSKDNLKDTELEIKELKNEDEEKFYFFFNKRKYNKVLIKHTNTLFPQFSLQSFPYYKKKEDLSSLKSVAICSSIVQLDENVKRYRLCENLERLELSYDNIREIPDSFTTLKKLQYLCLRRNSLSNLPKSFENFRDLKELDLSENLFVSLPKELFSEKIGLEKINLNSNLIENFEIFGAVEESKLEYLFLAQNKIKKIPIGLKRFKYLKFINLDENCIEEIPHNIDEEISNILIISTKQNEGLKNKIEEIKKNTNNINLNKRKLNEENENKENENAKVKNLANIRKTITNLKKQSELEKIKKKDDYSKYIKQLEELKIQNPSTQIENDVAKKMEELIDEKILTFPNEEDIDINEIKENILLDKYEYMVKYIENLIYLNRENELGLIENMDLKIDFKKCYGTYLKIKEYETTGNKPLSQNLSKEENKIFEDIYNENNNKTLSNIEENKEDKIVLQNIDKKKIIQKREDVSNLLFLRELNSQIASSKIKITLQYLRNIDFRLRKFLINLWESRDLNSFILILTELKIFMQEIIIYFDENRKYSNNIHYDVIKNQNKNVIHDIFYNDITIKILYRLGLDEKKSIIHEGIEQDNFGFDISDGLNIKHKLFENFLERFIYLIRQQKVNPFDLDL